MTSKEFEFIKIIKNTLNSNYIGNDCAYLDEYKIAISSDTLIENVHFSFEYMTVSEVAKKAILVNISDILASGAKPKYAMVNLSGKFDNTFINEFYKSINAEAKKYEVEIIGGDLTKSDKIMISITILGDYKNRNVSSRYNAEHGYIVAIAGEQGSSAQGLEDLKKGLTDNYFINYHKSPELYPKISTSIAQNTAHPYAMMDSSDGLIDCLYQISTKSNVKIEVDYNKIPKKTSVKDFVLFGGEDYSLVVCMHEKDFDKIKGLYKIGSCTKGTGVYIDNKKIQYKGYNHFD